MAIAIGVVLSAITAGCSQSQYDRVTVSGTVTHNGQPLKRGKIRFYPVGEEKGSLSGADIIDGKYVIDRRGGVPAGTHRIEIKAYNVPDGPRVSITEASQYLPAKYNSNSELELTIEPDSASMVKDFDLTD